MKKLLPLMLPLVLFVGYGGKKELVTKNAEPVTETNTTEEAIVSKSESDEVKLKCNAYDAGKES
ncbi:MAG TPA: hypothetical protein EYQ23_08615 [Verrucomicrobiales bacterium]|nr:hypothetical protein [Verrucomicrobiales bacterium]